ncbi:RNA polymerase sigma factor [Flexithrix dorotheae]|uniref:RNA polymerase sigma factor n=1 Tax=Flexithrix dorotheae TaxID=70993 RepID=UPI000367CC1F|nr:sigma-70 family RNA polymerase sigma factor [Flexithrix dorotheae]
MNDLSVLQRIHTGDQVALEEVYLQFHNEFLGLILRKFNKLTREDAEDIFSESMVALYENITNGRLNEENLSSTLKTYLFQIGINKTLAFVKKDNRFNDIKIEISKSSETFYDEENEHFENETEQKFKIVETCLTDLGNPCKRLLELHYYHKKRMIEIAELLNYKNADVAKNQKAKCMKRLRKLFNNN